ncbi:MAG: sensor histidine kinase, partial [Chryseotalea sp.]
TENKKVQSALMESENRFRTLQEASFGGIGLHDKGIIIDCNQGLCELTGYTQKELIGMNGLNLIAEEYRSFVLERIVSGYDKPYDTEGVKKDGSRYFLEIRGKNIPYLGKQIRVTEFRDITDRKKSEQKISEQNAKLIAVAEDLKIKNEQLQEFTQIVSHNLRSPVGNILTLLEFVEQSQNQKEKDEYHALLKVSAEKIQNTLTELHEVLRIKQNTNIEKQHLYFDDILDATKLLLHTQIVQSGTRILADFTNCPTILYPKVYLDSIFLNLISNAIKYGKTNITPLIEIKTEIKEGTCYLTCADNGLGIDLNKHGQKIFKLNKTFHSHPESRGIGLFMIKNQIEAMGGMIGVESEVNNGTTFIVNFGNQIMQ